MLDRLKVRNLTSQLFILIAFVALVPIAIMAIVHNEKIKDNLLQKAFFSIDQQNYLISNQINRYFDALDKNITSIITPSKSLLLEINKNQYIKKNIILPELRKLIDIYGYHNLFIGDLNGNVLYNAQRDVNDNIKNKNSSLPRTQLSIAANATIKNLTPIYTGIGQYAEYSTATSTIFATPLVDNLEKPLGFIAIQLSFNDSVPRIIKQFKKSDLNINHYIIDISSKIQYHSNKQSENPAYSRELPYKNWISSLSSEEKYDNQTKSNQLTGAKRYKNNNKTVMIGAYRPITIAGNKMLLVTETKEKTIYQSLNNINYLFIITLIATLLLTISVSFIISSFLKNPIRKVSGWVNTLTDGSEANCHIIRINYELEELSRSVILLDQKQRMQRELLNKQQWLEQSLSGLYSVMNGVMNLGELCNKVTIYLARCINSPAAALYLIDESWKMSLKGQYGCPSNGGYLEIIQKDEGGILIEAARNNEAIELTDLPEGFFRIESAHLDHQPDSVYVIPFCYGKMVKGVLVFASVSKLSPRNKQLLADATSPLGSAIHALELTIAGAMNALDLTNNN